MYICSIAFQPAVVVVTYVIQYVKICKASLFSDLKAVAGPSSVHCDGAQSVDGCRMHPHMLRGLCPYPLCCK